LVIIINNYLFIADCEGVKDGVSGLSTVKVIFQNFR